VAFTEKPRTLIVCCEGTSHHGKTDTNVNRLLRFVDKKNGGDVEFIYMPGPGAPVAPTINIPLNAIARAADLIIAWSIRRRIQHVYREIIKKYKPGYRICLFGFSRGAYIARCLASMICAVGLLPPDQTYQINTAWELYINSESDPDAALTFKEALSRDVIIDFLGLWDTVASLGVLATRRLPVTTNSDCVKIVRHAVALDERRARFCVSPLFQEFQSALLDGDDQQQREVWFVGCHSDVGGGSTKGQSKSSLSNPPLLWMMQQIDKANIEGFRWDLDRLKCAESIWAYYGPESQHPPSFRSNATAITKEVHDALRKDVEGDIDDHLSGRSGWWLVEYVPQIYVNPANGRKSLRIPKGRYREVFQDKVVLHGSVQIRQTIKEDYRKTLEARFTGERVYTFD